MRIRWWLVLMVVVSHAAQAGDRASLADGQVSFARNVLPILAARCTACHMVGDNQGGFVLEREFAYLMTVGVPSNESPLKRIEPGFPDRSYLFLKLTGAYRAAGGTGWNMPIGFVPLNVSDINVIRAWIAAGAPNN